MKKIYKLFVVLILLVFVGCVSDNSFTVTFDGNGGDLDNGNEIQKVEDSSMIIAPTYVMDGYEFKGWDKDISSLNEDTVVKAIWEKIPKYYNVTFNTDGGTLVEAQKVKEGDKVEKPEDPEKRGHIFVCWLDATDKEYDFDSEVDSRLILYAKYEKCKYNITFDIDGEQTKQECLYGDVVSLPSSPLKQGYSFTGWYCDGVRYNRSITVSEDMTLVATFTPNKLSVVFECDGVYNTIEALSGEIIDKPADPKKDGHQFLGWYDGNELFDFSKELTSSVVLRAHFKSIVTVTYDFGYDCFQTKEDLRLAYYTDFYDFLKNNNCNFERYNINNLADFLYFMDQMNYERRTEMQAIGDAFSSYYIARDLGGSIEDQPVTKFVGWCWQNGKYRDFLEHLIEFFAYWRTDEGYSQSDPNGNDFFADSWAAMVDTAKFFHFNGDTLQTNDDGIYHWFTSLRVKDALDYIPGVGRVYLTYNSYDEIVLPISIKREGYTFLGWYDDNGEKVTSVNGNLTVHAKWAEKEDDLIYKDLNEAAIDFANDCLIINNLTRFSIDDFDTSNIDSIVFKNMLNDEATLNKWKWLFKAICELDNRPDMDPDVFEIDDAVSYYMPNIWGIFHREKHIDTCFETESVDFGNSENYFAILNSIPKKSN